MTSTSTAVPYNLAHTSIRSARKMPSKIGHLFTKQKDTAQSCGWQYWNIWCMIICVPKEAVMNTLCHSLSGQIGMNFAIESPTPTYLRKLSQKTVWTAACFKIQIDWHPFMYWRCSDYCVFSNSGLWRVKDIDSSVQFAYVNSAFQPNSGKSVDSTRMPKNAVGDVTPQQIRCKVVRRTVAPSTIVLKWPSHHADTMV